ncbi:MAG: ABC transporter permease [Actinomycetota bacterium]|nr:ABC transporter permease [Actinomycetota bacterium]
MDILRRVSVLESFRVALDALKANRIRSGLTMLGVIIGVTAVILLVSIGIGVQSDISREIMGLGSDILMVLPGKIEMRPGGGHAISSLIGKLTYEDAQILPRRAPHVRKAVPLLQEAGMVKFGNRSRSTQILGTTHDYVPVRNFPTAQGRFFERLEVDRARKVCTLGATVAENIFEGTNPIGKQVRLAGQKFTVLGVMTRKGGMMGINLDDQVWIPITVGQRLFGVKNVGLILVEATHPDDLDEAMIEIKKILSERLSPDEFSVLAQEEILGTFQSMMGTLTLALGGIASISLLVGGIGIMNIMLVSVTERTREVGIRKAVGARTFDIMIQFIIEAVTLSMIGGIIGIALGAGGSLLLNRFVPSEVTLWSVLVAFGFSAMVGIFFGVYPAYKASRLDPIEALRYE